MREQRSGLTRLKAGDPASGSLAHRRPRWCITGQAGMRPTSWPRAASRQATDRRGHVLRFLTIDRAILQLDHRIEVLPRKPLQVSPLAWASRPLHDLVRDPLLVQRPLHAPARPERPPRGAPMELDGHARDDTETSRRRPAARRSSREDCCRSHPARASASSPTATRTWRDRRPRRSSAFASTRRPLSRRTRGRGSRPRGISQCS